MTSRAPGSDSLVEIERGVTVRRFVLEWSRFGPEHARTLLRRFPEWLALTGRSVLALGRGAGDLGIEVARQGARSVVAMEMADDRLKLSRARLGEERDELPIELRPYRGSLGELGADRFDVVLAADAFRRYGADPSSRHLEELVAEVTAHLVEDGGLFAVAFGPAWKAPYGGGIDSRLPWAHLVLPETVIFAEFRRARPGNRARRFEDIGINRITVARFRRAMRDSGLECVFCATNVGDSRALALVRVASRLPGLEEHLTQNVYGVWRRSLGRRSARER